MSRISSDDDVQNADATPTTETTKNNLRHLVFWKDIRATKALNLEFDGIPFIIFGHKRLECQNGPDYNKALKEKQENNLKIPKETKSRKEDASKKSGMIYVKTMPKENGGSTFHYPSLLITKIILLARFVTKQD
ncbi:hypothetical protein OS493_012477 [Desmophyllum pertusum]|uniref:Uncharacterized protein n=1 Tax=Desmophyllum pertusum TaxID=174260 RepID=A0A9W9ZQM3_9CNID|nr:hypothetical protein OS493_012477 [Desmophyllum pertusum]